MPNFNQAYPVSNAEHGKFVPLTQHELLTLGQDTSASDGRYAILTYDIGRVNGTVPVSFGDTASVDAFGRARTAEPYTIFDSKQICDKQPVFWSEVSNGTAAAHYLSGQSSTLMSVSANGDYSIRQTKMRFNYQPGKSQFILLTTTIGNAVSGVQKRLGYYNSSTVAPYATGLDGIFLEHDGINLKACIANNGTVTESIPQSAWNYDKMDGTGPSAVTLDITKSQIFYIDFEWLGVGRVRVGTVIDGNLYRVHEFNHANIFPGVYMASSNHSLRYEIRSTGGADNTFRHICSTVISEGGVETTGIHRAIDNGDVSVNVGGTPEAVLGMRLDPAHIHATVIPIKLSILNTSTDDIRWFLTFNPTMANTGAVSWVDIDTGCVIERGRGNGTQTITNEGVVVASGYISNGLNNVVTDIESSLRPGTQINGTRDELWLCIENISGGSGDYLCSLTFRQLL